MEKLSDEAIEDTLDKVASLNVVITLYFTLLNLFT